MCHQMLAPGTVVRDGNGVRSMMLDQSVPLEVALERPDPGEIVEVDLFLTGAQAARLEELANRDGLTLAQFLRRKLRDCIAEAFEDRFDPA